jgi:hypothetical protein
MYEIIEFSPEGNYFIAIFLRVFSISTGNKCASRVAYSFYDF